MNIFIFRYGLLIIDDLPLRIGQGRNILRTRIVKVTYNLHLTPILLIEEIMACISINHHLLLFTWILLLAEFAHLFSEMRILFNGVIEYLRGCALVGGLVELDSVDLLYETHWWIMAFALAFPVLFEFVCQMVVVLAGDEIVLLYLLFFHHGHWFVFICFEFISLFVVVSRDAAWAAGG